MDTFCPGKCFKLTLHCRSKGCISDNESLSIVGTQFILGPQFIFSPWIFHVEKSLVCQTKELECIFFFKLSFRKHSTSYTEKYIGNRS